MKPAKSFGILNEGHRGGAGRSRESPGSVCQDWDTSGMVVVKCFGILIEGYRGGALQIG